MKKIYTLAHESAVWTKIANKYLLAIIDRDTPGFDKIMATNKCGFLILDCLLTKKTSEKIIKLLAKKYSISCKRAKADFLKFISNLKKLKIID